MKSALSPIMMAAALGGATLALPACTTTRSVNISTCQASRVTQAKFLKSVLPSSRVNNLSEACLFAEGFVARVEMLDNRNNTQNYHMTGSLIKAYEDLDARKEKDKWAAQAISAIDQKMPDGMKRIYDLYEKSKPQILGRVQEEICVNEVVAEMGGLYDKRICKTVKPEIPSPGPNP